MPRIRQKANAYRNEDFRRRVLARLAEKGLQQHDLAEKLNLSDGTVSTMLRHPDKIQVERLRKIILFLELEPESVLALTGFSAKNIQKGAGQ